MVHFSSKTWRKKKLRKTKGSGGMGWGEASISPMAEFPNLSRLVAQSGGGEGKKRGWFCWRGRHVHMPMRATGAKSTHAHHPATHAAQLQTGHGPVVGHGPQIEDP